MTVTLTSSMRLVDACAEKRVFSRSATRGSSAGWQGGPVGGGDAMPSPAARAGISEARTARRTGVRICPLYRDQPLDNEEVRRTVKRHMRPSRGHTSCKSRSERCRTTRLSRRSSKTLGPMRCAPWHLAPWGPTGSPSTSAGMGRTRLQDIENNSLDRLIALGAPLTNIESPPATRRGRIPDFPVTRSHPPASWPSAANSSICRTYRKTAGEESRRRSPVANRWMRP